MISSQLHAHRDLGWKQCIYQLLLPIPPPPPGTFPTTLGMQLYHQDPQACCTCSPRMLTGHCFQHSNAHPHSFCRKLLGGGLGSYLLGWGAVTQLGFFFSFPLIPVNCGCLSKGITSVSFKLPGFPSLSSQQYNFKTWAPTWGQSLSSHQRPLPSVGCGLSALYLGRRHTCDTWRSAPTPF